MPPAPAPADFRPTPLRQIKQADPVALFFRRAEGLFAAWCLCELIDGRGRAIATQADILLVRWDSYRDVSPVAASYFLEFQRTHAVSPSHMAYLWRMLLYAAAHTAALDREDLLWDAQPIPMCALRFAELADACIHGRALPAVAGVEIDLTHSKCEDSLARKKERLKGVPFGVLTNWKTKARFFAQTVWGVCVNESQHLLRQLEAESRGGSEESIIQSVAYVFLRFDGDAEV